MTGRHWAVGLLLLLLPGCAAANQVGGEALHAGQILVQFHADVSQARAKTVLHKLGAKVLHRFATPGMYLIALPQDMSIEEGMRQIQRQPEVQWAEPNYPRRMR